MPAIVAVAEYNALNPFIGLTIRLINRWSCSTILFKYLIWRTNIFSGLPYIKDKNISIRLIEFKADLFEPLLSIVTLSGSPLLPIDFIKNCLAAFSNKGAYLIPNDL